MKIHGRIAVTLSFGAALCALTLPAHAVKKIEFVPGEYVVKLKPSISLKTQSVTTLEKSLGGKVRELLSQQNLVVVNRPVAELSTQSLTTLAKNPIVEYAEPNYIYRVNRIPNDPGLGELWGLKNDGQSDSSKKMGRAGIDVGAEKAWDITTGSEDVVIAVIDTGVDYNHKDLAENIWTNTAEANGKVGVDDDKNGFVDDIYGMNFVDTQAKSDPMDDHGHGTHCSGTIAARGDDGKGIVGVSWKAKIMGVKFLSASGSGTLEGAVRSIDYATKMGVNIMSNSWGGGGFSKALEESIQKAHQAGILFVAAAGNDSNDNDADPTYPANYQVPNVISVAAINNQGGLASFSNYGKNTVHVAAPGVNIYSSLPSDSYDSWSGTSMATPHVSGIASLLLSYDRHLSVEQLKERIVKNTLPVAALRGKTNNGGMANAYYALTNQPGPADPLDPSAWTHQSYQASSAHPYPNKGTQEFEISVPGASKFALFFEKFETEPGYDQLIFLDKNGNELARMSGTANDSYSPVLTGDYVKVKFVADDSVNLYGFDITKIAYQ